MIETVNKNDLAWAEKLNAPIVSYTEAVEIMRLCHGLPGMTVCLVGRSGIGKTQLVQDLATQLREEKGVTKNEFGFVERMLSVTGLEHLAGLYNFPADDPTVWNVIHEKELVDESKKPGGIVFLDEVNRNADRSVQNALFSWIRNNGVHGLKFPAGWSVVTAMNPACAGYMVAELEAENAFRRSLIWVYLEANPGQWIIWANANKDRIHKQVTKFIQDDASRLLDKTAQDSGQIGATPASWEKVSQVLFEYERRRLDKDAKIIPSESAVRACISGIVGTGMSQVFMDQYQYKATDHDLPSAETVLLTYGTDKKLRKSVQKLLRKQAIDAKSAEEYLSIKEMQEVAAKGDNPLEEDPAELGDAKGYIFVLLRAMTYTLLLGDYTEFAKKLGIPVPVEGASADDVNEFEDSIIQVIGKNVGRVMIDMPNELYSAFMAQISAICSETPQTEARSTNFSVVCNELPEFTKKAMSIQLINSGRDSEKTA